MVAPVDETIRTLEAYVFAVPLQAVPAPLGNWKLGACGIPTDPVGWSDAATSHAIASLWASSALYAKMSPSMENEEGLGAAAAGAAAAGGGVLAGGEVLGVLCGKTALETKSSIETRNPLNIP